MTQLDYEDADAVAMREKFLRHAGKIVEKPATTQSVVIGEVRDLEEGGWGTGRRTRNANKVIDLVDDDF
jgi:DNA replication regulator DPB11